MRFRRARPAGGRGRQVALVAALPLFALHLDGGAPLSSRLLLESFWRQCRIAALSKALTWFCLFPLAIAIEPTYRAIYAEQGMMQGGHPVMFDADITNSDPWTIGLTPFDVLTFLALGLVGPVAITQPLGALMYGPPPGPPRETSSA